MYIYKEQHKLKNINIQTMTADCSICGVTNIKKSPAMKNAVCKNKMHIRGRANKKGIPFEKIPEKYSKAASKEAVHRHRAALRGALPFNANVNLMRNIYAECPDGYEVDHIKALAHGGLHHEDNLQYLPLDENRHKSCGENYDKSKVIDWRLIVA